MSWQGGSSIFKARSKGRLNALPHRKRMPWTYVKELVPTMVLNQRDRALLDGHELPSGIERSIQKDPMDILKYIVARYDYDRSTGETLVQLAQRLKYLGRGQRFYRKEWMQGTYEKYVTLSHTDPDVRDGKLGKAFGYITFHGESSLRVQEIDHADVPGWFVDFEDKRAIPFTRPVPAPLSIGTEIPVDPTKYRLKSYPCYDMPNPPAFVEKLLKDRGILPSVVTPPPQNGTAPNEGGDGSDSSQDYKPG
eukprot:PhF_6_TR26745/c0_g1_i1/m.39207/K17412/MRPS34; small subunit ribosomal protein S34